MLPSTFPPGFSQRAAEKPVLDLATLPPILRALVATDGTVTRLLEAYFWQPMRIRVVRQEFIRADPFGTGVEEDVASREVAIGFPQGRLLLWASSFIVMRALEPALQHALRHEVIGIGALLRRGVVETYREHRSLEIRAAGDLAPRLEVAPDDLVIARTYRIHRREEPFIELTETFPVDPYTSTTAP